MWARTANKPSLPTKNSSLGNLSSMRMISLSSSSQKDELKKGKLFFFEEERPIGF